MYVRDWKQWLPLKEGSGGPGSRKEVRRLTYAQFPFLVIGFLFTVCIPYLKKVLYF